MRIFVVREYFDLAALRRLDEPGARGIPFVSWLMPVIAAAFIVDVFRRHERARRACLK